MKRAYYLFFVLLIVINCKDDKQLPLAVVTTADAITEITYTSAKSGGAIVSDGGSSVTMRGVCWSSNPSPTINDSKTLDGTGGGIYVSSLTGLTPNTSYFIRAYATTANGTAYGLSLSFTTTALALPTLTTSVVRILTLSTANSGGTITSDGGASVTARGVCWSTTSLPTIAANKTIDGSGTGIFASNLSGLSNNGNIYYVRAYATNSVGTAYGNEVITGSQDADLNIYHHIFIGVQVWLMEDLRTTKYLNGDPVSSWSYYNNDPQYNNPYGKLYSFAAVSDSRKLCPIGFHVANEADWNGLISYLGGTSVAGGKMKEAGTSHWVSLNVGADNSSGFTALPGGRRADDGSYAALGTNSIWWSSTDFPGTSNALYYSLFNSNTTTFNTGTSKGYQMSVRCVKD